MSRQNRRQLIRKIIKGLNPLKYTKSGNLKFVTPMDPHNEVFYREGQGVYLWVNKSELILMLQELNNDELEKILYHGYDIVDMIENVESEDSGVKPKPGQYGAKATDGKTPQETINSYTPFTKEEIVILYAVRLSNRDLIRVGNSLVLENLMKPDLGKQGTGGSSTETFATSIAHYKSVLQKHLYPNIKFSLKKLFTWKLRFRQEEAIEKFKDYITAVSLDTYDFLLAAVMRFGKNFTFLHMAMSLPKVWDNGNIYLLTNRPDVFPSLIDDCNGHIDFYGKVKVSVLGEGKDKVNPYSWKPSSNHIDLVLMSSQLLKNKKHKKLINHLKQFEWNFRGIDEADTGMMTELSEKIIDSLKTKYTIWITGTPWKLFEMGIFSDANTYLYDYVQQILDKVSGIDPRAIEIKWFMIKVLKKIEKQAKWFTDEEGFTLTKLFKYNKETKLFVHQTDVEFFIEGVLGYMMGKQRYSPYRIVNTLKHTMWMLPRDSDAIVALKSVIEKILKSHGKEDEYVVLAATGQESKSVKEIKDFEQVLKDYPDKKTIVLTLQRWNRGTSQPWNGIFMMNDTQSLEEYFQTAFRCTTPYEGKDYGYVFDFNPNRTLLMINAYARKRAESKGETDPEKIIKELLDVFCIYSVEGGTEFKRVNTVDLVLDAVTNSIYPAQTLRNSAKAYTEVSYGNLSSELLELLEGAPSISKSWKHDINKSSHKKGKNWKYKSIPKRKLTDKEKQESDKLISKIGTMIAKLPLICELGSPGYSSVEEIVEKVDGVMFEGATDTPKKALELIMSGKHGVKLNTYKINLQLI